MLWKLWFYVQAVLADVFPRHSRSFTASKMKPLSCWWQSAAVVTWGTSFTKQLNQGAYWGKCSNCWKLHSLSCRGLFFKPDKSLSGYKSEKKKVKIQISISSLKMRYKTFKSKIWNQHLRSIYIYIIKDNSVCKTGYNFSLFSLFSSFSPGHCHHVLNNRIEPRKINDISPPFKINLFPEATNKVWNGESNFGRVKCKTDTQ